MTLDWWNDLWLNEGFASYVEYLGADYAEPTWNLVSLHSGSWAEVEEWSVYGAPSDLLMAFGDSTERPHSTE